MSSYHNLAYFYDELTQNVDYQRHAEYLISLFNKLSHEPGLTLDLACGTGSLTLALKQRGIDIYAVDSSAEMLSVAREKFAEAGEEVLCLCQKMQELDLFGTVDTVVSTLDSINHLRGLHELEKAVSRVSLFLNPGGYFIFDMNTLYKHRNILAGKTFVYDMEAVYCVWQNRLLKDGRTIKIELDIFEKREKDYTRFSESFCEYAFEPKEIRGVLEKNGFEQISFFDEQKFTSPQKDSSRIYVAARKGDSHRP